MDTMEVNKTVAAVLVAGIAFFITGTIGVGLVHNTVPKETAIKIEIPPAGGTAAPAAPAGPETILPLLASADVEAGKAYTQKICVACHTFTQGGPAGVGPNLYNEVGGPHAHMAGFNYSDALKAKKGDWTYSELNKWLYKPSAYAPGTRMAFAGIPNTKTRADVIAYLRSLSPDPKPLPTQAEIDAAKKEEAAAAPTATPAAPKGAELPPIAPLLASADPAAGEAYTKKICVACHTFNEGGRAGVGPNLYNVVGGPHAHMPGFNYTEGMKAKKGPWTFAELNEWLYKPSAYVPGTRMAFAGIPNAQDRANVIDYLRTLSPHPEPLPTETTTTAGPGAGAQTGSSQGTQPSAGGAARATPTETRAQQTTPAPPEGAAGSGSPTPAAKSP